MFELVNQIGSFFTNLRSLNLIDDANIKSSIDVAEDSNEAVLRITVKAHDSCTLELIMNFFNNLDWKCIVIRKECLLVSVAFNELYRKN